MKFEICLSYRDLHVDYVEEYDSLDEAQYVWLEGPMACDCNRAEILRDAGVLDGDACLPCNEAGAHEVHLLALRPYMVH